MSAYEIDGMTLPRFSASAADAVRDRDHAREILNAYYRPEITHDGDPKLCPDREVRIRGRVHLVIQGGVIISVGEYNPPEPSSASPVLAPADKPRRRRGKGGAGNRFPTDVAELVARIEQAGARVDRTKKHYVVTIPGSAVRVGVPRNPRDWRSIRNSVNQLRALGLDVSRDAC